MDPPDNPILKVAPSLALKAASHLVSISLHRASITSFSSFLTIILGFAISNLELQYNLQILGFKSISYLNQNKFLGLTIISRA